MNWAGLRSVWSAMVLLTAVGVLTCQFKRQLRFESAGRDWSGHSPRCLTRGDRQPPMKLTPNRSNRQAVQSVAKASLLPYDAVKQSLQCRQGQILLSIKPLCGTGLPREGNQFTSG
jgi:hypothetical protein